MTREVPSSKFQVPSSKVQGARCKVQGLDASLPAFPEPEAREKLAGGAGREAPENHRIPARTHVSPSLRPGGTREAFASSVRNRRGPIVPFLRHLQGAPLGRGVSSRRSGGSRSPGLASPPAHFWHASGMRSQATSPSLPSNQQSLAQGEIEPSRMGSFLGHCPSGIGHFCLRSTGKTFAHRRSGIGWLVSGSHAPFHVR